MKKDERLFGQFPPVTTRDWMEKITADLKGADFNKKLVWNTPEGLKVMPFYRQEDLASLPFIGNLPGEFPFVRGNKTSDNKWLIRQDITVGSYTEANRKALAVLMKGVDSLGFIISDPETICREEFELLLKDIDLESIEISFRSNGKAKEILGILRAIVEDRKNGYDKISGAVEADPLGRLMRNGTLCIPEKDGFDYLAALTASSGIFPNLRTIHIGASAIGNAGGDLVQELAYSVAMGSEYFVQLTERGLDAAFAATKIRFSFGTGSSYFAEIAKLRAARYLWSAVLNRYIPEKAGEIPMMIHCVTSRWNKTLFDPHVNMLRTQTEAMSAVLGGADSLTVEPFDSVFRDPDEFSERIARNQQLLLKEESYFDKVVDPAAGSYYIENLTGMLATEAWKLFVETEDSGGFLQALRSGCIQAAIGDKAARKKKDVSSGRTVFVGTNRFPDPAEKPAGGLDYEAATGSEFPADDLVVKPVRPFRGAREFEELRTAVVKSGRTPVVFLFTIGNPAMRKARAQFSAGFFGCAGYKVIDNRGFSSVEQGLEAFYSSGADILVICSSDEEYTTFAPGILAKAGDSGKIVVIAGNPASADELKAMGIEFFVHLRSDAVSVLKQFSNRLGINA